MGPVAAIPVRCLPSTLMVRASVATAKYEHNGGGPNVDKFKQVSSLDHQMSTAGGLQQGLRGLLYSEVPCLRIPTDLL